MDGAEEWAEHVLESDDLNNSGKGGILALIASLLVSEFQRSQSTKDLARGIAIYEQATALSFSTIEFITRPPLEQMLDYNSR